MNPYEALGLAPKLDLELGDLERVTREASLVCHPDSGGDEVEFQRVRQAGGVLKEPFSRLKAALEMIGVSYEVRGGVPGEVMDYFSPVAGILKKVDDFTTERRRALSGLGKAVLDVRIPGLKMELEDLIQKLGSLEEGMIARFPDFDACGWDQCGEEMAEVFRGLIFVSKWLGQLRESNGKIFEALLGG
jgi:curved DNA-binding protein CbpA